jgi:DNA (cytosine-5)-methyltransferase 1
MRILDLFCGAGGASMGYHRAFPDAEIVGVDINPQPNYPFQFVQADAMAVLQHLVMCGSTCVAFPFLADVRFVHASPPCQDHSTATAPSRSMSGAHGTGWMLEATINQLSELNVWWIVENVEAARMPVPSIRLCGSSFGLDVRRHRKFASNIPLPPPPCDHGWQTPRFQSLNNANRKAGKLASVVGVHGSENYAGDYENRCRAMGIDWMTNKELAQAIPPAYTQWIGEQYAVHEANELPLAA